MGRIFRQVCCYCVAAVLAVLMTPHSMAQIVGQPLSLVPVGRVAQKGILYHLASVIPDNAGGCLYIGVDGSPMMKGKEGFGVISVDLHGKGTTTTLFWRDLVKLKTEVGLAPRYLAAVAKCPNGDLLLVGHFDGPATSLIRINPQGKLLIERLLFDGDTHVEVRNCLVTDRGDIVLVGSAQGFPMATLLTDDLKLVWAYRYENAKNSFFGAVSYVPEQKQFYIAGITGTFSKFGEAIGNDVKVLLLSLDYDGQLSHKSLIAGTKPAIAPAASGLLVAREAVGNADKSLLLSRYDWQLEPQFEKHLTPFPSNGLPMVHPHVIETTAKGDVVVAAMRMGKLFVRIYAANGEPKASKEVKRIAIDLQSVRLVGCDGAMYLISTESIEPLVKPGEKPNLADMSVQVLVERVQE